MARTRKAPPLSKALQPAKRGERRAAVVCACLPGPRRIQLTPRQIEDGPIVRGLCCALFELPRDDQDGDEDR